MNISEELFKTVYHDGEANTLQVPQEGIRNAYDVFRGHRNFIEKASVFHREIRCVDQTNGKNFKEFL